MDEPEPAKKPLVGLILSGVLGVVVALLLGVNFLLGTRVKPKPPEPVPVAVPKVWRNIDGETKEQMEARWKRAPEGIRRNQAAMEELHRAAKRLDDEMKNLDETIRRRELKLQMDDITEGWKLKRMEEDLERSRQIFK